jgi:DNA polymerase-4
MSLRKIIHIDMDAFYASVEQREDPSLVGKALVVGGDPRGRGVVATASYEARRYGIHSAMPCSQALRLCPHVIFVRPNMALYVEVSQRIRAVFHEASDLVEPVSLDEAYIDVTTNKLGLPLARDVARYIKGRIEAVTGLTASAGVAPNKFLAKVASDFHKPNGLTVVPPQRMAAFMAPLPVEKVWGVGPVTAAKLHALGIRTVGDLGVADVQILERRLGKAGPFLHRLACGDDPRPVTPHREPKSRGAETTLTTDILDLAILEQVLEGHAQSISVSLAKRELEGRTITLKVRYDDFTTITRSRTLARATANAATISATSRDLLRDATEAGERPIRLVGVSLSGFGARDGPEQLWLDLPLP